MQIKQLAGFYMKESLVFNDWTLAYCDLNTFFIYSINTAKNVGLNLL